MTLDFTKSLGIGEGEAGAEANYLEAGGGAPGSAEAGAGLKFAFEGSGERRDAPIVFSTRRARSGQDRWWQFATLAEAWRSAQPR